MSPNETKYDKTSEDAAKTNDSPVQEVLPDDAEMVTGGVTREHGFALFAMASGDASAEAL